MDTDNVTDYQNYRSYKHMDEQNLIDVANSQNWMSVMKKLENNFMALKKANKFTDALHPKI